MDAGADGRSRDSSEGKTCSGDQDASTAARLTCFSGPFCDARGLFEEVRHCGLADLQVIGPVGLRRQGK